MSKILGVSFFMRIILWIIDQTFPRRQFIKKLINGLACFIFLATVCCSANTDAFEFKDGDIIFQDLDCGPLCDAIEEVTTGYKGSHLSHVGILVTEKDGEVVIEAIGQKVSRTALKYFLNRTFDSNHKAKILVGRLNSDYQAIIPSAVNKAYSLLGKPYDEAFDINNDAYYCSELIYYVFHNDKENKSIFPLHPMTFKDPATRDTSPIWVDYFKKLKIKIPEGAPGINPGAISLSPALTIYKPFGTPDGWQE